MKSEANVIIVGAGPTGLSLACQLTRFGIDFVIIEKNEGPTPFSKAMAVHARTLEIYEQMDLAATAVERGAVGNNIQILEGGKVRGHLDFSEIGKGMSPYPFVLFLEQSQNERLLYDYLRQQGHDVDWHTTYQGLKQDESGVTVDYTGPDGRTGQIKGKYVVGCDGARSTVRGDLGLSFGGSTFERTFYVADVELDWELGHDGLAVALSHDAFVLFFPMKGERRFRIIGVLPENVHKEGGDVSYEEIEADVRKQCELELEITDVHWFSSYKVHTRRVDSFSSERGFLAGDAAHIHSPAGGQGMNTGIQDAYNLGWKLAVTLRGQAGPGLLDTYNEERLENAQRLLETTDRMFQLAAGSDWFISMIRTTFFPPLAGFAFSFDAVQKAVFPLVSQIGITYRDCRLSTHRDDRPFDVKAGDRMPFLMVDGASLYDRLREPKFHLLTFSDGQSDYHEVTAGIAGGYPEMVDHHIVPLYPHVAEVFGTDQPFSVLLRPDNYIAYIAADTSVHVMAEYFSQNIGRG